MKPSLPVKKKKYTVSKAFKNKDTKVLSLQLNYPELEFEPHSTSTTVVTHFLNSRSQPTLWSFIHLLPQKGTNPTDDPAF
jgi:hypothetical protein